MTRLEHLLDYIKPNDIVIDVGCETATLSILLAKKGIKSIASDIKIDNAINRINKLQLGKFVDVRKGYGLSTITIHDNISVAVFAGMGALLILKILKSSKVKINKIVTISNNKYEVLRSEMNKLGYKIYSEEIIKDNSKFYNIIVFVVGNEKLKDYEIILGKNHINKSLFIEKYEIELKRLRELCKIIPSSEINAVNNKIKIISNLIN